MKKNSQSLFESLKYSLVDGQPQRGIFHKNIQLLKPITKKVKALRYAKRRSCVKFIREQSAEINKILVIGNVIGRTC